MELIAQKREKLGKSTKHLKRDGQVPAVVFSKGIESENITVNYIDFVKVFDKAGETGLITIKEENKATKVLVKDVQYNPVTDKIIHVGFYKPDLTQKTNAQVPVEVIGEEENDLIKSGEAMVITLMQEITVEALPEDLPHSFTIDVSQMKEIGDGVKVGELEYDREKVEVPDLEPEDFVIRIDEVTVVEEPEEEISEEEALEKLEATGEKDKEETDEESGEKKADEKSEE
jgi:large subunit ribosomal protein L25